jgi:S-adenosylmethionine:tRNA ribosyltransferase-isomerase
MRTKLSQFKFDLPEGLIAQYPAQERDQARLMVVDRKSGKIEHKTFRDILNYFDDGDALIFNNTKVFPARMYGKKEKTGAKIEVFLLRELNSDAKLWDVLVDPARKIRVGNKLYFADDKGNDILVAEVVDNTTSRGRTIRFFYDGTEEEFRNVLKQLGSMPLPKYITRIPEDLDDERYQTVYAKETGAVVTVEEHQISGGMGSAVAELLAQNYPVPIEFIGVNDAFGQSGKPQQLIEHYGMGEQSIYNAVHNVLRRKHD